MYYGTAPTALQLVSTCAPRPLLRVPWVEVHAVGQGKAKAMGRTHCTASCQGNDMKTKTSKGLHAGNHLGPGSVANGNH